MKKYFVSAALTATMLLGCSAIASAATPQNNDEIFFACRLAQGGVVYWTPVNFNNLPWFHYEYRSAARPYWNLLITECNKNGRGEAVVVNGGPTASRNSIATNNSNIEYGKYPVVTIW